MKTCTDIILGVLEAIGTATGAALPAGITTKTRLYHDLGVDTLSLVAILCQVEARFGLDLTLETTACLHGRDDLTVGHLVGAVAEALGIDHAALGEVAA